MNDDPKQEFLQFLYQNRLILGIVVFVAAINGIATLVGSLRSINSFLGDVTKWFSNKFYTRKRLVREAAQLADELQLFFEHRNATQPILDIGNIRTSTAQLSQYSGETRIAFDNVFRSRILDMDRQLRKHQISAGSLDRLLSNPTDQDGRDCTLRDLRSLATGHRTTSKNENNAI